MRNTNRISKRIYLVRHGENMANITKEFSYRSVDYSLTEKGRLQAGQTAVFLKSYPIDAIYASPLKRAAETGAIIGQQLGLPSHIREEFREINVGSLENEPPTAANWHFFLNVLSDWFKQGKHDIRFPQGENYHILWQRMRTGLIDIMRQEPGQHVVIVGHGGIFTMTMKDLCPQLDLDWIWQAESHNCSISTLDVQLTGDQLQADIVSWASYDHLSGEAATLVSGLPEGVNLGD